MAVTVAAGNRGRRHVAYARRRGHRGCTSIAKESPDSPRKIYAAVAMIGARVVRRVVLASPAWAKRQKRGSGQGRSLSHPSRT